MSAVRISSIRAAQHGAGIVETMIGILIGMLVVLVVYNMLSVAEGYKRMTTGVADSQITGLLAHFIVSQDAANAGSGLSSNGADYLGACTTDEAGNPFTADNTLLPIGLIITEAGDAAYKSDAFVVRQSSSPHVTWPVPLRLVGGAGGAAVVPPGGDIQVQSPNGFMDTAKTSLPTATDQWWAVMIANDGTGKCGLAQIQSAAPDAAMDTTGEVLLKQGTKQTTIDYKGVPQNGTGTPAYLLNLGRDAAMRRVRYEVNPTTAPAISAQQRNQLMVTDCSDRDTGCAAGARNPIASNIALMKVQYGIDTSANPDGTVDCWTPGGTTVASAGGTLCPVNDAGPPAVNMVDWTPASILASADPADSKKAMRAINRIVAVRIGIVVASEEPDLRDPSLFVPSSTTMEGVAGTRGTAAVPAVYLFNCTANTDAGCPNRVRVPAGAGSALGKNDCRAASNAVLCDGFRYRTYEVVIPLRNNIYSATLPP
jgi:hypothetical protein